MDELTMARDVDYSLILQVLHKKGYSLYDIGKKTGVAISTLSTVKQETKGVPKHWYDGWEGIALQEYYRKALGTNAPFVGDYIELEDCYENEISITQ